MKDIDWKILQILHEKRSITKAAEALFMTQSALTKRIKAIEDEWNVEIVKRSSKGVMFTEEGLYLVKKSAVMLELLREVEDHFAENRRSKVLLKIGLPNSFARLHMPKLLKGYMSAYNQIQFKTISNSSDVIMQHITDGTVDIGIICGDYPFLGEKVCLMDEELFAVTPKGMPLESIEHMPLVESYLNPIVKQMINQWWRSQFGTMPHEAHHVPYFDIAIEMVENGLGICFLFGADWNIDREKLQLIPIYDKNNEPVSRKVWMMVSERCFENKDIMDFVSFVEAYYQVN